MRWIVDVIGSYGYGVGEERTVITTADDSTIAKQNALKLVKPLLPETTFSIANIERVS